MPDEQRNHALRREVNEFARRLNGFHRRLQNFEATVHAAGLEAGRHGEDRARFALKSTFNEVALAGQWLVEAHLAINEPYTRPPDQAPARGERPHE